MGMFHECPYCNASLDPGERCDCQSHSNTNQQEKATNAENSEGGKENLTTLVSMYVNLPTFAEITKAISPAKEKLKHIIEREGGTDASRLDRTYLAQLIAENIRSARMTKKCIDRFNEKRRVAEANTPLPTLSIVSQQI